MGDSAAPSASDLAAKAGGMKHVDTKTGSGPSAAELAAFAAIYDKHGGDLGKVAGELQCKFKDGASAKDGADFAKQFLSGFILAE